MINLLLFVKMVVNVGINKNGKSHRDNGEPSVIHISENKVHYRAWYVEDKLIKEIFY